MEAFMRTGLLLGDAAMQRLSGARVAVFGVGGVGGYVCEALARCGVGALELFDSDEVNITNLNRQIIALRSTVGMPKVEAMRQRLLDVNPEIRIECHQVFYLPENAEAFDLSGFDYVVDCVDTVAAKMSLVTRCQAIGVPVISALGAANKLDPSQLRISDIFATSVCPLAKVIRHECKKRGVRHLKVAWSTEESLRVTVPGEQPADKPRRHTPASAIFVPASMGLLIASEVVRDLAAQAAKQTKEEQP